MRLRRTRESVATSDMPQLEREQDEEEDEREEEAKRDKKKRRKAQESLSILVREAELRRAGTVYEATLLREGPGNARDRRYYTKQALRQSVSDGMFEGLQAYANHPTASEERDRPERDVRQLVGHFREARYTENSGAGRVVAKFVPIEGAGYEWVTSLIEAALQSPLDRPLIGISIDGYGATDGTQEIGGRVYDMVREIAHLGSADIVTRAGAGGRFHRRLQEAWRAVGEDMKLLERDFSAKARKKAAKGGAALSDGSYPIYNQTDANNAWKLRNNGKHSESTVVAHIRKRVKALGLKMPGSDETRESDPAAQAGDASKEVHMKPAELQEKIKAAVAKLREASQMDEEETGADALISEALSNLDECVVADVEVTPRVEVREVEVPVAATDSDADKLAAENDSLKAQLREVEAERDKVAQDAKDAQDNLKTIQRGQMAMKVMREAELPSDIAADWFDQVVAEPDEESMKRVVERKKAAADALLKPIREVIGIEGVPARVPALAGVAASGGSLMERMGIDASDLSAN